MINTYLLGWWTSGNNGSQSKSHFVKNGFDVSEKGRKAVERVAMKKVSGYKGNEGDEVVDEIDKITASLGLERIHKKQPLKVDRISSISQSQRQVCSFKSLAAWYSKRRNLGSS